MSVLMLMLVFVLSVMMLVRMSLVRLALVGVVMMLMLLVRMTLIMIVIMSVLFRRVNHPFVNGEFHAFDLLPLLPVKVQMKISQRELREFPLQRGRLYAQVVESADHHVAANSGNAVEEESAH